MEGRPDARSHRHTHPTGRAGLTPEVGGIGYPTYRSSIHRSSSVHSTGRGGGGAASTSRTSCSTTTRSGSLCPSTGRCVASPPFAAASIVATPVAMATGEASTGRRAPRRPRPPVLLLLFLHAALPTQAHPRSPLILDRWVSSHALHAPSATLRPSRISMARSWSPRNPVLRSIALINADSCLIVDVLRALPFASNGPTSASSTLGITTQSAAKAAVARGSVVVDGVVVRSSERRLVPSEAFGGRPGAGTPRPRHFPAPSRAPGVVADEMLLIPL